MIERTARIARVNALSIVAIGGLSVLWAALDGAFGSAAFAVALCGAAASEMIGSRRLATDPAAARPLLVGGELALLVLIGGYALWQLLTFDVDASLAELPSELSELLRSLGGEDATVRQTIERVYHATYATVLVVTVLYQGGMASFYQRRVARILAA